jgi:hypothetical protein
MLSVGWSTKRRNGKKRKKRGKRGKKRHLGLFFTKKRSHLL